jgi:hypothetical protein
VRTISENRLSEIEKKMNTFIIRCRSFEQNQAERQLASADQRFSCVLISSIVMCNKAAELFLGQLPC